MQGLTFINCLENILQVITYLLKTIETDMTEFVLEPWCPVGRYSEYFFYVLMVEAQQKTIRNRPKKDKATLHVTSNRYKDTKHF